MVKTTFFGALSEGGHKRQFVAGKAEVAETKIPGQKRPCAKNVGCKKMLSMEWQAAEWG